MKFAFLVLLLFTVAPQIAAAGIERIWLTHNTNNPSKIVVNWTSEEPVYDVDAMAFRRFFKLPDDEWKWHFDLPEFDLRFVALDFKHISDFGTTWQTCHAFDEDSEQFGWHSRLMEKPPGFVVTLYNERNSNIRNQAQKRWHELFRRGTCCITGFGYFAERAEVDGFPYYNTSLNGRGNQYPDPNSKFLAGEDSYILLTVKRGGPMIGLKLRGKR